jgi:hypothetical protein
MVLDVDEVGESMSGNELEIGRGFGGGSVDEAGEVVVSVNGLVQ